MAEDIIFKRRNRLKKHFVNTSNVLLCGYKNLSDGAKQTYQVIDSLDWEDKETGDSKGYVFPAIKTIAEMRSKGWRAIYRQIEELEETGLLTRMRRKNMPSILMIEDVSDYEANLYLEKLVDKGQKTFVKSEAKTKKTINSTIVKNDNSQKAVDLSKMTIAYKKEYEKKENEINVNENFQFTDTKKRYDMQGLNDIMKQFDIVKPKPSLIEKNKPKITTKQKPEEKIKRDYYAEQLATELQDQKSLGCYRAIVDKVPQPVIYETLSSVKETWKEGKIKKSRGALFVDIIKTYCDKKHIDLLFHQNQAVNT
jgi:hypothetical protein